MLFILFFSGVIAGGLFTYVIFNKQHGKEKNKLHTDQLTGLKNSYYFENIIHRYLKKGSFFLLLDIDNFKEYNTRFGYEKTDELLKLFVHKIKAHLPENAEFIRYKFGDEFLIILKQSDQDAFTIAERLKEEMKSHSFNIDKNAVIIQFSVGITPFQHGDTQQTIISRLTSLLGDAKQMKASSQV
jgi:diguanylate cyclase (GGDEF)-like protein